MTKVLKKAIAVLAFIFVITAMWTMSVAAIDVGDVDEDGVINANDAIYLLMHTFF